MRYETGSVLYCNRQANSCKFLKNLGIRPVPHVLTVPGKPMSRNSLIGVRESYVLQQTRHGSLLSRPPPDCGLETVILNPTTQLEPVRYPRLLREPEIW